MLNQNLIFSEKWSARIKRHLLFWVVWGLYFGILHAANPFGQAEISFFRNLPFTISESILFLIPQIILAYTVLYLALPLYFEKNKIIEPILITLFFWFICGWINLFMVNTLNPAVLPLLLPERFLENTNRSPGTRSFMALMANFKGAFTATAAAVSLKFFKHWYLKEQRNLQLQKEKAEAQLQLLTAQVHPHFLFNTLNNIYSQTQITSPEGSKMILELSDMLRYILDEGSKSQVPLKKELSMLQDYINLEKVRYGNKLDLHISIPSETGELQIAPLMLLPFLENCFKHGASKFLRFPWINMVIELKDNILLMKLMNGKDLEQSAQLPKSGLGIMNVKKRLELLYADKYELKITDEADVFIVDLRLELSRGNKTTVPIMETTPTLRYA